MYSNFTCPKCGSFMFGSWQDDQDNWHRRCHGNGQWVCRFEFPVTDDHLYFTKWVEPEELAFEVGNEES